MAPQDRLDEVPPATRKDHATMHAAMPAPKAERGGTRVFIEGRRFIHTSQGAKGEHECVATPPMPACPCGAFPNLEWSWSHL